MFNLFYGNWEYWELRDKVTFDYYNLLIIVNEGVTEINIKEDVYSAWKRWAKVEANAGKAPAAVRSIGGDPTISGQKAGDIYFTINNWRLQIDIATTAVTGVLFSDDFDTAYVDKNLKPIYPAQVSSLVSGISSDSEVTVNNDSIAQAVWEYLDRTLTSGGSGGLTPTQEATLNRIDNVVKQMQQYVFVDTELPVNGDGSSRAPFNNVTDAKDFAENNEIFQIVTYSEITIDRNLKNFNIIGIGNPVVNFNNQTVDKSQFKYCTLRGQYTGSITAQECVLDDGFYLNGFFENCGLGGDLTCIDGSNVLVKNCASTIAGTGRPTISMNGLGSSNLSVRDNQGGLTIKDCNNVADNVTVEFIGGSLTFDTSCTAGTMVARGLGIFVDNTNGATVINETAYTQIPDAVWNKII